MESVVGVTVVTGAVVGLSYLAGSVADMSQNKLPRAPAQPPSWVFAVVWPLLYFLTGVSLGLALVRPSPPEAGKKKQNLSGKADEEEGSGRHLGVAFGVLGLWFDYMWTPFYVWVQQPAYSLVLTGLSLFCHGLSCLLLLGTRPVAALLQLPIVVWLSYALFLNIQVVQETERKGSSPSELII